MKRVTLLTLFVFSFLAKIQAQAPERFNYQAVARDNTSGAFLTGPASVKIDILDAANTVVFTETHTGVPINKYGLFTVAIGSVNPTLGNVNWSSGAKFIRVSVNNVQIGNAQLLSVPYALYANAAGSGVTGGGATKKKFQAGTAISIDTTTVPNTVIISGPDTTQFFKVGNLGKPAENQLLFYNGGKWTYVDASTLGGGAGLPTTATAGQVLKYKGGAWVANADSTGFPVLSTSITDIGKVMQWNGTAWEAERPSIGSVITSGRNISIVLGKVSVNKTLDSIHTINHVNRINGEDISLVNEGALTMTSSGGVRIEAPTDEVVLATKRVVMQDTADMQNILIRNNAGVGKVLISDAKGVGTWGVLSGGAAFTSGPGIAINGSSIAAKYDSAGWNASKLLGVVIDTIGGKKAGNVLTYSADGKIKLEPVGNVGSGGEVQVFRASTPSGNASNGGSSIVYSVKEFNSDWYDATTGRFTPKEPGYYLLAASARMVTTMGSSFTLGILKNGTELVRGSSIYDASVSGRNGGMAGSQVVGIFEANGSTDYFEVRGFANSSLSSSVLQETAGKFAGFKIGGGGTSTGGSSTSYNAGAGITINGSSIAAKFDSAGWNASKILGLVIDTVGGKKAGNVLKYKNGKIILATDSTSSSANATRINGIPVQAVPVSPTDNNKILKFRNGAWVLAKDSSDGVLVLPCTGSNAVVKMATTFPNTNPNTFTGTMNVPVGGTLYLEVSATHSFTIGQLITFTKQDGSNSFVGEVTYITSPSGAIWASVSSIANGSTIPVVTNENFCYPDPSASSIVPAQTDATLKGNGTSTNRLGINPGANNTVLSTDGSGVVSWVDKATLGGTVSVGKDLVKLANGKIALEPVLDTVEAINTPAGKDFVLTGRSIYITASQNIGLSPTSNLGIGSVNNPSHRFTVYKKGLADSNNVRFEGYSGNGKRLLYVTPTGVLGDTSFSAVQGGGSSPWAKIGNKVYPVVLGDSVGIGTSSPGAKLDVVSSAKTVAKVQGTSAHLVLQATDPSLFSAVEFLTGNIGWGVGRSSVLSDFYIDEAGTGNRLVIKRLTGKVGIGTINPANKLDVNGGLRVDTLKGTGTRVVTANSNGVLLPLSNGLIGEVLTVGATGLVWSTPVGVAAYTAGSGIEITASRKVRLRYLATGGLDTLGTGGTLRIAPLGVLGSMIAPNAIDSTHLINGRVGYGDISTAGASLNQVLTYTAAGWKPRTLPGGGDAWLVGGNAITGATTKLGTTSAHGVEFITNNNLRLYLGSNGEYNYIGTSHNIEATSYTLSVGATTPTPILVATSDGLVGIGGAATTPGYALTVNGNLRVAGFISSSNITETSDARYKMNIATIGNALSKVQQLRGVSYDWNRQSYPSMNFKEGKDLGLIAQEVEKVLPELVNTDANGYKSVQYSHLVPVLVEAIKEQQKQIEMLKGELASKDTKASYSEERIKTLESSVKSLTTQMQLLLELVGSREGVKAEK